MAQNFRPHFNFNGGVALPQGDFKSTDLRNPKAGLAKNGFFYGFDIGVKIKNSPFGFALTYKRIDSPIDFTAASTMVAKDHPGIQYGLSTDPWVAKNILMGIYGSLDLDSAGRFNICPRLLGGWMSLTPYHLNLTLPQGYNGAINYPERAAQKDFAFLFGLSFRYAFLHAFYLSLNADYLHSDVEYPLYTLSGYGVSNSYTQPVDYVNLSLGLGVKW